MALNKLHKKDFTIAVKTGTDVNRSKFAKECVQGELYFATDTKKIYVAETTAGEFDATISEFTSSASGIGGSFSNRYALELNGSNQYLHSSSTTQSYSVGTISLWFKPDSTITSASSVQSLIGFGGSFTGLVLGSDTGSVNNEVLMFRTSTANYAYTDAAGSIDTTWHHVAVTWDGAASEYKIYLDGTQIMNTKTGTHSQATIDDVLIGFRDANGGYFDGIIDEVAIFSQSMTAIEVANLRTNEKPTALTLLTPQPLSWWRMLDSEGGSGSSVADNGTLTNDMDLINSPTPYDLSLGPDSIYKA